MSAVNATQENPESVDSGVWHHLTPHKSLPDGGPFTVVSGEGMRIRDARGREYLDATSGGVWSVNVGYGRREIADAVHAQLMELCYFAQTAGSRPAESL